MSEDRADQAAARKGGAGETVSAELRAFVSAACFLTRIPLPSLSTDESWRADLARAPRYFPLVGALVGLATGLVFWALCHVVPAPLAAALALALEALVTGAFHEDALADYCDAFGGGRTPERVREILKDSRLGTYGTLGLGLGVLVRWTALASLAPALAIVAAMAAGAIGRAGAVAAMRLLAPAGSRESLSRDVGAQPSAASTGVAFGWMALACLPALVVAPVHAIVAVLLAVLPLFWIVRSMRRVLGGVVGDGLGAIAFVAQALALTAFAARL